jgi:tetratricopeptide (TPR) repeat protein
VLLITTKVYSSDTLYYSALKNSINLANKEYKLENYQQLHNCCERIISLNKNEWLPYYYGAYAYINMSFIEKNEENREMYCDKAQVYIDEAMKIKSRESELYVLQALLYFARMSISPMLKGPIYISKASSSLSDAEKLDPDNPRIYYLRGKSTIHTPSFFGGGKEAAIPILEKARDMYNKFKPKSTIHPNWGQGDTERLYKECTSATK